MRVVGIDYGERRLGIAVSDPSGSLARPVETLDTGGSLETAVARVIQAIAALERGDEPITGIVLGLPRRLDGSRNEQTPRAEAFAQALREHSGRTVVLQDERLTSHEADGLLAARERDWRVRKRKLDAAAAAVILQEYLDTRQASGVRNRDSE